MLRPLRCAILALSLLGLAACQQNNESSGGDKANETRKKFQYNMNVPDEGLQIRKQPCTRDGQAIANGPWMDPSLSTGDCAGVRTTFYNLKTATISQPAGSNFDRIFSGRNSSAVAAWVNDRVLYLFPAYAGMSAKVMGHTEQLPTPPKEVVAQNMGLAMWLGKKELGSVGANVEFYLGKSLLDTSSPSGGQIRLGSMFPYYPVIFRMATLVHEARHSDCESTSSELCGLKHSDCPAGHDYEFKAACDDAGIGPYYIGAVYAKALAETCVECSEEEKQLALVEALDSLDRVQNLEEIKAGREANYKIDLLPGFSPTRTRTSYQTLRADRLRELGK